jgi:dihydroorotase
MKITVTKPDDWHLHLRTASAEGSAADTAALPVPRHAQPQTPGDDDRSRRLRDRILAALPAAQQLPLMTLTTDNPTQEIRARSLAGSCTR